MIAINVKGLIKYMEADDAQKRGILADYKFPDVGKAPIRYYRDAHPAIWQCLAGKITRGQMLARGEALTKEAMVATVARRARLNHNARAIIEFDEHFGDRGLRAEPSHRLYFAQGGVRVGVHPELWVYERDERHILKLELGTESLSDRALATLAQLVYHAAVQSGWEIDPRQAGIVQVATGEVHRGKRIGPRLEHRIAAALENIEAIWPSITRPTRAGKDRLAPPPTIM
jgi:hypothetical protein